MYSINRHIAIIKPKQPYLDWIRHLPDSDHEVTMKELQNDATAILIPENHEDPDGMKFIRGNFEWIFEVELESWWANKGDWPTQRDWKTFQEWFEVEFHSEVIDPTELPIRKEEY